MIRVNELRIGNIVNHLGIDYDQGENKYHDPDGDEVAEVLAIRPKLRGEYELLIDAINSDGNRREAGMADLESVGGIQLTREWLERCGFVQDRNGWHIPGSQFSLTENLFPCWLDRMLWPGGIPDFRHVAIEYLHQLQNLYFGLTGEELNVKL